MDILINEVSHGPQLNHWISKILHVFVSKEIFIARMNLGRDGENISIGHKARELLAVQEFQQHLCCLHSSSQELKCGSWIISMLESLSFCGWMTQILIKILITVFLNSTTRLTAWLKTFLLKGASFYFARWLSKLVEGWHIFLVLVKMILIRLMVSFTEVGPRYKLFFNPETGKMLQSPKLSIHCLSGSWLETLQRIFTWNTRRQ